MKININTNDEISGHDRYRKLILDYYNLGLEHCDGNRAQAHKFLGISRRTLITAIKNNVELSHWYIPPTPINPRWGKK